MSELVFFLEEQSAEALLQGLLPRIVSPAIKCRYIVFEGKQDLEKQLVKRMRGYRVPGAKFIVMRDKDRGQCEAIKKKLVEKCHEAGKTSALIRIACHEIESWYLADLAAVETGLNIPNLSRFQDKKPYTEPDNFPSPVKTLRKIAPSYQKVGGSRSIGPFLDLANTRSTSFKNFINGIRKVCGV